MTGFLILVLVILAFLIWAGDRLYRRNDKLDPVLQGVQAVLTAFAILLAGLWYFVERKGMSHAELALKVHGVKMPGDLALVQLRIEIRNVGHTLLRARDWDVRLQSIFPTDLPLAPLADTEFNHWPRAVGAVEAYHTQELRWPTISYFRGQDLHEVEPGEMDLKNMDFVVSCDNAVLRAGAALRKLDTRWDWASIRKRIGGEMPEALWWKERALVDLHKLCAGKAGTTLRLDMVDNEEEEEDDGR